MKQLEQAWRAAQKKRAAVYIVFAVSILLIVPFALMDGSGWDPKILGWTAAVCAAAAGLIVFFCLSPRSLQRQIRKLLDGKPYAEQFAYSIDRELTSHLLASFYNKQYRLSLFLTKTWLVLISVNGSVIRKRAEIRSVERKLIVKDSTHALKLCFYDDTAFVCRCNTVCDEVIALINQVQEGDQT